MVKMLYVNTESYTAGVYDDFLFEYQCTPIRRADGTLIPRMPDGFVGSLEMESVLHMLYLAGYAVEPNTWELLTPITARAIVTSDTAGFQPREHAVHCPYGPAGHETWHHSGICDEHSQFRDLS